jgi:hypothetical protein
MKRSLLALLIFLICFNFKVHAQEVNVPEQIQTIRKSTYSKVLELTDAEAQKFWPVFEEMQAKLNEIRKQAKIERLNIAKNYDKLTDAQMERALDNLLTLEQDGLDVKKKYYQKFKKVLPIKKVAKLPKAEREFKKELLNRIKSYRDLEE